MARQAPPRSETIGSTWSSSAAWRASSIRSAASRGRDWPPVRFVEWLADEWRASVPAEESEQRDAA